MRKHSDKCAVCGISREVHSAFEEGDEEHTIWKRSGSASATLARKWPIHAFGCKRYGGHCPRDNNCYALKNPRRGDFGWGECIYREEVKD